MPTYEVRGDYANLAKFLKSAAQKDFSRSLEKYGQEGAAALAANTPTDSGATANAWSYNIEKTKNSISITWTNSHIVNGYNVAILIQYGHGTGTGGYVQGRDYINPVLKPLFDRIADELWREVSSL